MTSNWTAYDKITEALDDLLIITLYYFEDKVENCLSSGSYKFVKDGASVRQFAFMVITNMKVSTFFRHPYSIEWAVFVW